MNKRNTLGLIAVILCLVLFVIVSWTALAQSGGPYELNWLPPIAAAETTTGGAYDLFATTGQISAGSTASGGDYEVVSGSNGAMVSGSSALQKLFAPYIAR